MQLALDGVEGYFSFDEAWALNRAVAETRGGVDALRVVEIGSYKGRSTIAIGLALSERGGGTCVSIDPHAPTGKASYALEHGTSETYEEFLTNIRAAHVDAYVRSETLTSAEAAKAYDGRPIDVLFIDGSHDYEDVVLDIALWTPYLKPRAVVAFNDPYAPGVNRAIRDYVTERYRGRGFEVAYHVNNTLFLKIDEGRTNRVNRSMLSFYLYIERQSFKLWKLALKGAMESRDAVYRKA